MLLSWKGGIQWKSKSKVIVGDSIVKDCKFDNLAKKISDTTPVKRFELTSNVAMDERFPKYVGRGPENKFPERSRCMRCSS